MYYMDYTYILLIPAILLSLWASARVNSTYKKYSKMKTAKGLTGAQAARYVLDSNGLRNVTIERISGNLTDHYDPKANVIRLSDSVYSNTSTAAVGVACHEAGHAIQHAEGYAPVKVRTAIVPVTNIGSKLAMPLILIGIILSSFSYAFIELAYVGILCFCLCVFFQLITLPTEFNASSRALNIIESSYLLTEEEQKAAKKVLSAAALTYVAALAVSVMQLLRLLLIVSGGGRRRN